MTFFFKFNFLFSGKKIERVGVGLQKLYRPISGCHVKSRFTVGPLMATIFLKNGIPHKLLCGIFQHVTYISKTRRATGLNVASGMLSCP